MFLSKLALPLSVLTLAACGTLSSEPKPLPFTDTEGKVQTATFMKLVGSNSKIAGEVIISGEYSLDIVRMNSDLTIAIRNDKGISSATNLKSLAAVKGFTLYTFSKYAGTVEVNRVSATKNVCSDYRGNGVRVAIADNMYDASRNRIVFKSTGNIAATKGKSKVDTAELDYAAVPKLSVEMKQKLEQDKVNMTAIHYARLEELIARGICS
ncbi:hypothetical protein [Neisseria perflava]|uniref:hypothetical protein n=1 Tax=Neisseria perflava TaxID=33053 RepID=UPI00209ED3A2|nr:hypothetical protein [Neisseria perflava]MCP1660650.1 hypothetical protein [Neisseria perflava]MCP1771902.1 hypothetical protein [Neisseria perflava]